jgi:5-methylcytosine-specific restriction endonuclease McrBC regulatory subunit McrC
VVKDEDDRKRTNIDITHKNAYLLMTYWWEFKKEGNTVATLLPVSAAESKLL